MTNLVIVGSQLLTPRQALRAEHLVKLWFGKADRIADTVASGGCSTGVDRIVEDEAPDYGFFEEFGNLRIFRPENQRWAPRGYEDRNLKMATWCDMMVSIRAEDSETYGSGWTADRAEAQGKRVMRYVV